MNALVWLIVGFTTAIFLLTEFTGPWALVTFISGLIFRYLLQKLVIEPAFAKELGRASRWAKRHPIQAQFYRHARAWAHNLHLERDPRQCPDCKRELTK